MNRASLRNMLKGAVLGTCVALGTPALAQYRPPPPRESERLTHRADEFRVEAGKAQLAHDEARAKERFRKAAELYRQALVEAPDALRAAEGFGESANALGDYAQVIEVLAPIVERHPHALAVVWPLAVAQLKSKHYTEAIPLLERVAEAQLTTEQRQRYYLASYYLGRYYLYERRGEATVKALAQYLRDRPEALSGSDTEIHLMMGEGYLLLRQPAAARAAFHAAKQGRSDSLGAELGLVAVLEQEGKLREAADALAGLIKQFPKRPEPRERAGWVLFALQQYEKAQEAVRSALDLKATATSWQLLGEIHLATGKPVDAEAALRQAVVLQPSLHPARLSLAHAIQRQQRHHDAARVLEEAAAAGLDTAELHAALGTVYRRAGRLQDAVAAHTRVVDKAPQQAWGHLLLGADHFAAGQWGSAILAYERALRIEPGHADAKRWLARALAHHARTAVRSGQLQDAASALRRAQEIEPTVKILRSLGATLLSLKSWAEAESVLERATALPGAGWQEQMLLGYARVGTEKPTEALAAFDRAASMTTEPGPKAEIRAGWALAKLQAGDVEAAVAALQEEGDGISTQISRDNLPRALVRRALARIGKGDNAAAGRDLDAARKLLKGDDEVMKLAQLAQVLAEPEIADKRSRVILASALGRRAPSAWEKPNTADLVGAWRSYRQGELSSARKLLGVARRSADASQRAWLTQLSNALDRREGELALRAGALSKAKNALRAAARSDARNPWLLHNLACVDWRSGDRAGAAAAWARLLETVPEAELNLGIDAQLRQRDIPRAIEHYTRYVTAGGARAAQVREWRDRLQALYAPGKEEQP